MIQPVMANRWVPYSIRAIHWHREFLLPPSPLKGVSLKFLFSDLHYSLSSIIYPLLSIIYPLSSILYHLSSIIYPLSSILYHLSSIIYPLSSILYSLFLFVRGSIRFLFFPAD